MNCIIQATKNNLCHSNPRSRPRSNEKYTKNKFSKTTTAQAMVLTILVTTYECLKSSSLFVKNIFATGVSLPRRSTIKRCSISIPICTSVANRSFSYFDCVSAFTNINSFLIALSALIVLNVQKRVLSVCFENSPVGSMPHMVSKTSFWLFFRFLLCSVMSTERSKNILSIVSSLTSCWKFTTSLSLRCLYFRFSCKFFFDLKVSDSLRRTSLVVTRVSILAFTSCNISLTEVDAI
mmetsp:Transcript_6402/g.9659  ORF Transcript_6402/g.9659 Transcript_6402/m.9659 type:complete len:236 (+) Transcript_6402:1536-2243(+)